jgi:hypothetical protein
MGLKNPKQGQHGHQIALPSSSIHRAHRTQQGQHGRQSAQICTIVQVFMGLKNPKQGQHRHQIAQPSSSIHRD